MVSFLSIIYIIKADRMYCIAGSEMRQKPLFFPGGLKFFSKITVIRTRTSVVLFQLCE